MSALLKAIGASFLATLIAAGSFQAARGQVYVEAIFNAAPIYDQAHLEDGINAISNPKTAKTPLMLAVESQDIAAIIYIIQQGADLDMRDRNGETAMDIAIRLHRADIQRILHLQMALHPGPASYYSGRNPTIRILSGQFQTAKPGDFVYRAMVVQVTDGGRPMGNAPVVFSVAGDGGSMATSVLSPDDQKLVLRTDQNGICGVYFQAPDVQAFRSYVEARVGSSNNSRKVVFEADVYNGASPFYYDQDPFQITNCIGNAVNGDSESVSWENKSPNATCILIKRIYPDGRRRILKVLPSSATSADLPDAWR